MNESTSPNQVTIIRATPLTKQFPIILTTHQQTLPPTPQHKLLLHNSPLRRRWLLPYQIPTHNRPLVNPPFSPQMTTRVQHGLNKPRQLLNLHTISSNPISSLSTKPINALQDHHWKMSMKDEYNVVIENMTWNLVSHPSNANIIRCLWIFRNKVDYSFEKYKAKLVSNGSNQ